MSNNTELVQVVQTTGLEPSKSQYILEQFTTFFERAKEYEIKARSIKITGIDQVADMKKAREIRLELKGIRVDAEKVRVALKEQSLREGKAIDGIANVIKAVIVPMEEYLEDQEKFVEKQEAARKEKLHMERCEQLRDYVADTSLYNLKEMSEEGFQKLLSDSKIAKKAIEEAEKKAEAEKIAKEKAEQKERDRMKKENERLQKEAAERDAKIAEAEAARKKAEAELKAKQEKDEAEKKAKAVADRKAKNAPDKEKLLAFANAISAIAIPQVQGDDAKQIISKVVANLNHTVKLINTESENL